MVGPHLSQLSQDPIPFNQPKRWKGNVSQHKVNVKGKTWKNLTFVVLHTQMITRSRPRLGQHSLHPNLSSHLYKCILGQLHHYTPTKPQSAHTSTHLQALYAEWAAPTFRRISLIFFTHV